MRNGDFLTKTMSKPKTYIVEELMAFNLLNLWGSIPGEGKSMVAEYLLYCVAYGAPFLGMKVTVGNVMFIDSENRYDILKKRITKIKQGLENDGYRKQGEIDFQHYSGFLLDDKKTWQPIADEIRVLQPSLIVLDHLAVFHNQDENSESQMKKVTDGIEELMAIKDSSVLALHHFNKKDTGSFFKLLRGSSALYAKSDTALEVRTLSKSNGMLEKVGLIPQRRKEITPAPIRLRIEEGDDWLKMIYDGTYKPIQDRIMDNLAHKIFHEFLDNPAKEQTVLDIKELLAGAASDNEIRATLRQCEEQDLLRMMRGKNNEYIYKPSAKTCPWCAKP